MTTSFNKSDLEKIADKLYTQGAFDDAVNEKNQRVGDYRGVPDADGMARKELFGKIGEKLTRADGYTREDMHQMARSEGVVLKPGQLDQAIAASGVQGKEISTSAPSTATETPAAPPSADDSAVREETQEQKGKGIFGYFSDVLERARQSYAPDQKPWFGALLVVALLTMFSDLATGYEKYKSGSENQKKEAVVAAPPMEPDAPLPQVQLQADLPPPPRDKEMVNIGMTPDSFVDNTADKNAYAAYMASHNVPMDESLKPSPTPNVAHSTHDASFVRCLSSLS